jgi:eukaryotic-like serine/threonine-protein kinase
MASEPGGARKIGRYAVYGEIGSGGMATVHVGRLLGSAGFARTVAIKRMHPHLAKDPEFVSMFVDEARLAARVHHPNVVSTLDVVARAGELFVVLEYVHGESLASLVRALSARGARIPLRVAMRITCDLLSGLHAAHEAEGEHGEPLGIVHRDVSPQNVIVGVEGVTRLIDFGVAKAAGRLQTTRDGQLKGKIGYMSPEQLMGEEVDRRSDIYSASVLLWELLTGLRLFRGDNHGEVMRRVLLSDVEPPSRHVPELPFELSAVVLKGLAREVGKRFSTVREMSAALEAAAPQASTREVGEWVEGLAGRGLDVRAMEVSNVERGASDPRAILGGEGGPVLEETQSEVLPEVARLVERSSEEMASGRDVQTSTPAIPPMSAAPISVGRRRRPLIAWTVMALGALVTAGAAIRMHLVSLPRADLPTASPSPVGAGEGQTESPLAVSPTEPQVSDRPAPSAEKAQPHSSAPSVAAKQKARPAAPLHPPRANCDPPFVVDDRGVRAYKRECVAPR